MQLTDIAEFRMPSGEINLSPISMDGVRAGAYPRGNCQSEMPGDWVWNLSSFCL
jgi:hypothetical protein